MASDAGFDSSTTGTVSVPGSGLVFDNTYSGSVTAQFKSCIIAAEETLAGLWTNRITISIDFTTVDQPGGSLASNIYNTVSVTYQQLKDALAAHASSPYAEAAIASLPASDPSSGTHAGTWELPDAYARMLGFASFGGYDDTVELDTAYGWSWGQDVIDTVMHEISEGGMGRIGGLGDGNSLWSTMDLFRYSAPGVRDESDGRDGKTTYFSYDGTDLSSSAGLSFNNEYTPSGLSNGGDTADFTEADTFGTGSPGESFSLSPTDSEIIDVLGWDPAPVVSSGATLTVAYGESSGRVVVENGGTLSVLSGGMVSGAANQGAEIVSFGGVNDSATLASGGSATIFGSDIAATVASGGSEVVSSGGAASGLSIVSGGGAVVASGGAVSSPVIAGGTLTLDAGAVVSGGITFAAAGNATLVVSGTSLGAVVSGLAAGDAIDLAGVAYGSGAAAFRQPGNMLEVATSAGSTAVPLDPGQNFAGDFFRPSADAGGGTMVSEFAGSPSPEDFYATGASGVLWQNAAWPGSATATWIWEMNGAQQVGGGFSGAAGTGWSVAGTGDFTGDGRTDILWQKTDTASGMTSTWLWEMNGTQQVGGGAGPTAGAGWTVAGTGDFNGDGKADMLWQKQNADGSTATWVWEMNGTQQVGGGAGPTAGAGWRIAGTGDFTGAGRTDILWQKTDSATDMTSTWLWEMNGPGQVGGGFSGTAGAAGWTVAGTGDFNGDGKTDMLWQKENADGSTATWIWEMDGTQQVGGGAGPTAGAGWSLAGIGDYWGDGHSDMLWAKQNPDGSAATRLWEMNGTQLVASIAGPQAGAGWSIAPSGSAVGAAAAGGLALGMVDAPRPSAAPIDTASM